MEKWIIDTAFKEDAKTSIKAHHRALKKWPKFEADVAGNPFFHPKHRRIAKLDLPSFPKGSYRYRDDPLRVVYYPNKKDRTVYPLAADTTTNIAYKKRSKS
ncbi:MAG: hypothetical protein JRD04_02220 [Deltaproteobacteria bacterium]|nr:hypothetical protein [Deltaproteobacteria bacterium]